MSCDAGVVWAEERTLSRLRHLVREYDLPYVPGMSLEQARNLLIPQAGRSVVPGALRSGPTFAIDDLAAKIEFLVAQGRTYLEPWWAGADTLDLTAPEGRARLSELLDVHHRRTQLAYREVVETSFQLLAGKLPLFQVMPVRYEIEVEFHDRGYASAKLHWRWEPVATFDDVGATITFPSELSDMWSRAASDAYRQRIDEALARYGRPAPDRRYTCGQKDVLHFVNDFPMHGGQVDETSVMRATAARIEEDLEHLFSELPASHQEVI